MDMIRKWVSPILTAILFIVIILASATTFSFVFDFSDESFWVTVVLSSLIMVVTNLIWMPDGAAKGEKVQKVIDTDNVYNKRANYLLDNQLNAKANEFCEWKNAKFEKELITNKLSSVNLDYWLYEFAKKYDDLNKEDKEKYDTTYALLTKKQLKVFNKLLDKGVKFKHLETRHITIGAVHKRRIVPKNREAFINSVKLALKILWGFAVACFIAFACFDPNSKFGLSNVIQIGIWIFSISFNVYAGFTTGYKGVVVYRHQYRVEQVVLCAEFYEYANINIKIVDGNEPINTETEKSE